MRDRNPKVAAVRRSLRHCIAAKAFGFLLVCLVDVAQAQAPQQGDAEQRGLRNGGFEELDPAGLPTGWSFPPALKAAGYQLTIDTSNPLVGNNSALVDSTAVKQIGNTFANLMQSIDAKPYRGGRLRFRAAVRTAELVGDGRAQLWFRVDRPSPGGGTVIGAFDNMDDRPIRNEQWKHYEIVGPIADDATGIRVGLLLLGTGKAWLDDATLEVVSEATPATGTNNLGRNQFTAAQDKPQPFFVVWLWLPLAALVLFALSQSNLGLVQRIAFRFSFAYWLLYSLPEPFGTLIPVYGSQLSTLYEALTDKAVRWTAANVLGLQGTLVAPNGSGDTTYAYVRLLVCFALACAIAVVWSAVDWRRTDHPWLKDLLRSYLRYVLAFTMLGYGLAKVGSVTNQFPEPQVEQLMKTYGESSPMNLVWTFMGASRAYTMFAGLGEVAGALLLIWRRTTILGAMVSFGVMLNVMMLNFCYDVPVKQYSAHLLVMALYLLLPDVPRLANLLLWNQPVDKVCLLPPYTGPRTIWVQRAFKAYMIVMGIGWPLGATLYREHYPRETRLAEPAFYGSYEVDEYLVDGQPVPPLVTDSSRWRSLSLRRVPWGPQGTPGPSDYLSIRMMGRSQLGGQFALSSDEKTLTLMRGGAGTLPTELTVEVPDDRHLTLSGVANGKKLEIKLHKFNRDDFLLINRGYRWINEYPFNR